MALGTKPRCRLLVTLLVIPGNEWSSQVSQEVDMEYTDENALAELAIAAVKLGNHGHVDPAHIRDLVRQQLEQVRKAQAGPTAASGKVKCSEWVEFSCGAPGHRFQDRPPIDSKPGHGSPIAWGGCSCVRSGDCEWCVCYECRVEQVVSPS